MKTYATVAWTPNDIRTIAPTLSPEKAEEWLANNAHHIQNRLIEVGWDVIRDLLIYDEIPIKESSDDEDEEEDEP